MTIILGGVLMIVNSGISRKKQKALAKELMRLVKGEVVEK